MAFYKIKEISKMTSLSIRTLQYYDDVGLLKPHKRSESGYRLYTEQDLLRLQQIVTLKYLGHSLSDIQSILKDKQYNLLNCLKIQANVLSEKAKQIEKASKLLHYIALQMEADQVVNWQSTATIIQLLEMTAMNKTIDINEAKHAEASELGKKTAYDQTYNPDRLYPIPREGKRLEIGIKPGTVPFYGFDCWNHYEVSWLNSKGKPLVAIAEIVYDCNTPMIIESKSLKLYFNSFNLSQFESAEKLRETIQADLQKAIEGEVFVKIISLTDAESILKIDSLNGECLDELDITCRDYLVNPSYLKTKEKQVTETLYSHLLKSNCLVTNQPDWGSVEISYVGHEIDKIGLLQYIVSFRNHNEFHEQCIERIFMDIMQHCQPKELTVYGRYTRRGGLDINPYRSTKKVIFEALNKRLVRQ